MIKTTFKTPGAIKGTFYCYCLSVCVCVCVCVHAFFLLTIFQSESLVENIGVM